jgi:hypothetical protein
MSHSIHLRTLYKLPKAPGYGFVINTGKHISVRLGSDFWDLNELIRENSFSMEWEGRCYPSKISDCRFFTVFNLAPSVQVIIFVLNKTISNYSFAEVLLMYERILETADW